MLHIPYYHRIKTPAGAPRVASSHFPIQGSAPREFSGGRGLAAPSLFRIYIGVSPQPAAPCINSGTYQQRNATDVQQEGNPPKRPQFAYWHQQDSDHSQQSSNDGGKRKHLFPNAPSQRQQNISHGQKPTQSNAYSSDNPSKKRHRTKHVTSPLGHRSVGQRLLSKISIRLASAGRVRRLNKRSLRGTPPHYYRRTSFKGQIRGRF